MVKRRIVGLLSLSLVMVLTVLTVVVVASAALTFQQSSEVYSLPELTLAYGSIYDDEQVMWDVMQPMPYVEPVKLFGVYHADVIRLLHAPHAHELLAVMTEHIESRISENRIITEITSGEVLYEGPKISRFVSANVFEVLSMETMRQLYLVDNSEVSQHYKSILARLRSSISTIPIEYLPDPLRSEILNGWLDLFNNFSIYSFHDLIDYMSNTQIVNYTFLFPPGYLDALQRRINDMFVE